MALNVAGCPSADILLAAGADGTRIVAFDDPLFFAYAGDLLVSMKVAVVLARGDSGKAIAMEPGALEATLYEIIHNPLTTAVLGLLLANVVVGIGAALYTKEFRLGQVADWLLTRAVPYVLGGITIQVVVLTVAPEWGLGIVSAGLAVSVWLFVIAAMLGKIFETLRIIGVPIPEQLGDTKRPPPP